MGRMKTIKLSEFKKDLKEELSRVSYGDWAIFIDKKSADLMFCNYNDKNAILSEVIEIIQNIFDAKHFIIRNAIYYFGDCPMIQTIITINHNLEFEKEKQE